MAVESADNISQLDPENPSSNSPAGEGDDQLRLIKQVLQASFPSLDGLITNSASDDTTGNMDPPDAATFSRLFTDLARAVAGMPSWGRVGLAGNSLATPGSNDWTSSRLDLGHYRVVFDDAASATENQAFVCSVTQRDDDTHNRSITTLCVDVYTVDVFIYNTILSAKVDDDFSFMRTK